MSVSCLKCEHNKNIEILSWENVDYVFFSYSPLKWKINDETILKILPLKMMDSVKFMSVC